MTMLRALNANQIMGLWVDLACNVHLLNFLMDQPHVEIARNKIALFVNLMELNVRHAQLAKV